MSGAAPVGYGVVGAGAFARFCAEQYRGVDGLHQVCVADVSPEAAERFAQECGVEACGSVDALLARADVGLVHLTTPPSTHHELAMRAIAAGKHVLCEKPLALTAVEAEAVQVAAEARGVRLGVNLIMRYNPLCEGVQALCDNGLLGEPLYASFQNLAKDEPLGPEHWFWDAAQSGGIFVEHGVHFFDVFAGWFGRCGEGEVAAAQHGVRACEPAVVEQARATVRYGPSVLADFVHSFTQASAMDRQSWRVVFERGDVRMEGWAPMSAELDFLGTPEDARAVAACFPGSSVGETVAYGEGGGARPERARFKALAVSGRYGARASLGADKASVYGGMLRALMADLLRAIGEPGHAPRVSGANGVASVRVADAARRLAETA